MSVTWSCNCFSRSTDLTRATSAIWSIGLVRYSSAPASRPATTSLESALAVHRMIGMNGSVASALMLLADLDAVDLRHHDVEQDQVGQQFLGGGERLLAVGGLLEVVALRPEPRHQDVAVGLVVVDDQDARRTVHDWRHLVNYLGMYSRIFASSARGLYGLVT